ncbi:MAG: hypothetical protein ACYC27_16740 [Armatimonadota bacterium]
MENKKHVPMEVVYQPSPLTWVGAVTSCLQALGIDCDCVDVAGLSGYAFYLGVEKGVCVSGPTSFDWNTLSSGINYLGRSTLTYLSNECHGGQNLMEATRAQNRTTFELAKREIEAGRPCVIWGAYIPEYAVVVGVTDDAYLVKSIKELKIEEQPPVPIDALDVPGGSYLLAFPSPTDLTPAIGDHAALRRVVEWLQFVGQGQMRYGLTGYDKELESLQAYALGCGYNAFCYTEGRRCAYQFLQCMAQCHSLAGEELMKASDLFKDSASGLAQVSSLFPFPAAWGSRLMMSLELGKGSMHCIQLEMPKVESWSPC